MWEITGYGIEQLEQIADDIKVAIVDKLDKEKTFNENFDANEWCKTHTVLFRKKTFFKTISSLFKDTKEIDGHYILVVKII